MQTKDLKHELDLIHYLAKRVRDKEREINMLFRDKIETKQI